MAWKIATVTVIECFCYVIMTYFQGHGSAQQSKMNAWIVS